MKKIKVVLISAVFVGLIVGGWALYGFAYNNLHYMSTENAKVTAKMVSVLPPKAGQIKDWYISEGDYVDQDQLMGREQDLTRIKSPMAGSVVKTNISRNQPIAATTELAVIADLNDIYIQANIEETQYRKIEIGQEVEITLDAYGSKLFNGHVYDINLTTQQAFSNSMGLNTSGTYTKTTQLVPIKISIDNPEKLPMTIGMNAFVKIKVRE